MRTVLIVSPHFPPSTLAGVHRARHLAKHLPGHGWRPIVVRADERHYTEPGDNALAMLVPGDVPQIRTGALPAKLARLFGVGDIGIRAFLPLARGIAEGVARYDPDVVMITGSPYYPMLLAGWIRRRFGLPVILDFQDPWVSAEGFKRPRWSKGWLAHRLALGLEPMALRGSSWITSVSAVQNQEMASRCPTLDPVRMSAIPIGGDPEDFTVLRHLNSPGSLSTPPPPYAHLCYVGTFLPRAGLVVRALFRAIARLKKLHPDVADRLRLSFIGTSNQPAGVNVTEAHLVTPIAVEEGVSDLVAEFPSRVPYLDALSILAKADGILLLGSDEPHYTASKIYPALMAARPWLSIFHAHSSAHEILSRAGGGAAFAFEHLEELSSMENALVDSLVRLMRDPGSFGTPDLLAYAPYTADSVARQFAEVFDRVAFKE